MEFESLYEDLIGVIEENTKGNCTNHELSYQIYIWYKQDADIIYKYLLNMQKDWNFSLIKIGNFIIVQFHKDSFFKNVLFKNNLFFVCKDEVRWTI